MAADSAAADSAAADSAAADSAAAETEEEAAAVAAETHSDRDRIK